MDVICDTNVWYRIGRGFDPNPLKNAGARFLVSPISFLEIGSEIFEKNFEKRRRAARAVLDYGDDVLEDPERHMARIWNLSLPPVSFDWRDAFKAVADASSSGEIQQGVDDLKERVRRRINLPLLSLWRNGQWKSFEMDVIGVIDSICPGYADARSEGRAIYMNAATGKLLRNFIDCNPFFKLTVMSTRIRLSLHFKEPIPEPTASEVANAEAALAPYAKAYGGFLYLVATKFAPRPNDWGDLEYFTYIQDGRKLLTFDNKWLEVAKEVGLDEHLCSA